MLKFIRKISKCSKRDDCIYTKIIKVVLVLVVILFLFTQLGIDVKSNRCFSWSWGIAIALAAKDTLANFFASLNIMTDNSFSQGDWIKLMILKELLLILE